MTIFSIHFAQKSDSQMKKYCLIVASSQKKNNKKNIETFGTFSLMLLFVLQKAWKMIDKNALSFNFLHMKWNAQPKRFSTTSTFVLLEPDYFTSGCLSFFSQNNRGSVCSYIVLSSYYIFVSSEKMGLEIISKLRNKGDWKSFIKQV